MNPKVVGALIIALMFLSFLFVTPRGRTFRENYIDEHFSNLGNFLKGITSRVSKSGPSEGEKLSILISGIPSTDFNGQKFVLSGHGFSGDLYYDHISFAEGTVSLANSYLKVSIPNMIGNVVFASDKIQITGKASQLGLNDLSFNTTTTDFLIIGTPVAFDLNDLSVDTIAFSDISGSLSWGGLKGIPPLLADDKLELFGFQGSIKMFNGKIMIDGLVSKMRLNGVNIGI